jgi:hypothetical protein
MAYPMPDGDKVIPIKPILFDKKRLSTEEFKNYIYEIQFKKSGLKVRDMALSGFINAISPYLKSVNSEVIHYGTVGDRKIVSAVVRSTIVVSYRTSAMSGCLNDMTFTALADGDVTNVPSFDTLIRTVETRALKRAIARALNISKVDFNESFIDEEEMGTSLSRKSPQDIASEKQRKIDDEERDAELDDGRNNETTLEEELDRASQDPHSGSTSSDW